MNEISELKNTIRFGYKIHYYNQESLEQTLNEVFDNQVYFFYSNSKNPYIIDAGANIGLSTLYFKTLYPKAKILCIEPDPFAFLALRKNIIENQLCNVKLVNAALFDNQSIAKFYGNIFVSSPDSRGNSLIEAWGTGREKNDIIEVNTVTLKNLINEDVDFLKMDIEGAEFSVLKDINNIEKKIAKMTIEVHEYQSKGIRINSINSVKELLYSQGYDHFSIEEILTEKVMPLQVRKWVNRIKPKLFLLSCEKI